ncbi:MAG: Hint domain-containing protein [Roseobacter sp.]
MSWLDDDPNLDALIGFWDFVTGAEKDDTGLADGIAQNGEVFGDAQVSDGRLFLDGKKDYFTTSGDDRPFDIDEGTVRVVFVQGNQPNRSANILLNRGEFNDKAPETYFAIGVTGDGRIEVTHRSGDAEVTLRTSAELFDEGDLVEVTYGWSGETGGTLIVRNLTTGASETQTFETTGLSFATDDDDGENFTFGAREVNENANSKYFSGEIESVAVYNRDIISHPERDGIVSGTSGDDLIDLNYTGDPDGDRIDNEDAILPGQAPNDDIVVAGAGDDIVRAGAADDTVFGGSGNDLLEGESGDDLMFGNTGDDTLVGGEGHDRLLGGLGDDTLDGGDGDDFLWGNPGDDTLSGGDGDDTLIGGLGDDTLEGGAGNDTLLGGIPFDSELGLVGGRDTISGGDDRDYISNVSAGDIVDGGEGGDDFDTLDLRGSAKGGTATITYTSADKEDGFVSYFDKQGNDAGTLVFTEIEKIIPICFTPGTLIATPEGQRPVETLQPGDHVLTRDNGIQEIRWVGAKGLTGEELRKNAHLHPVRIAKGALGADLPQRDMWLSPNHRVLVANDRTALYFEEREVLVAAKHLTALEGVDIVHPRWATYIHIMFDQHEVILSNGSWTESFQPGDYSLKGIGNAQRLELHALFPELKSAAGLASYQAARRSLKRYEAKLLTRN